MTSKLRRAWREGCNRDGEKLMTRWMTWVAILGAAAGLAACGGEAERPADLGLPGYTTGNFHTEESLAVEHVIGPHQHVLLNLESSGSHEGDSGGEGYDRLHYVWAARADHKFCLGDAEGFGHYAILFDRDEREIMRLEQDGECRTAALEPGEYWLEVHHGLKGREGEEDFIFVHPSYGAPPPPEAISAAEEDAANARFRVADSCQNDSSYVCSPVATGSLESWATDYVGQPQYGEAVVYGDDSSQYSASDTSNQTNRTGPTHRAFKFNGPCVTLAKNGVAFDDQMVGLILGPSTGVWIYRDQFFGGSNDYLTRDTTLTANDYIPIHSVSSLHVLTYSQNNTEALIESKSCQQCDLRGAFLSFHNLAGAKLASANLTDAQVENTDLTNADFTNATLVRTKMTNAVLAGAKLTSAKLNGSILANTDLSSADLSYAFLNYDDVNKIAGAVLTDAYMPDANLSHADLTVATLSNVHWYSSTGAATAEGANLSGANLDNAVLYRLNLNSTTIDGAKFDNAVLINADMRGISQHPQSGYGLASFNKALLAGTDFTNSSLPSSDLSNAQISRSQHDVQVQVKINRTQIETRTYTCRTTVIPGVTNSSVCPDRCAAPCDCSQYPSGVACTTNGRWTPPDPPEYIGDNDPDSW